MNMIWMEKIIGDHNFIFLVRKAFTPDFDESEDSASGETDTEDAIIDTDMDASSMLIQCDFERYQI